MVILNKNTSPTTMDTKRFFEILKDKKEGKNILTNELVPINKTINLAPESATILDIQ
jgi:hypothetical protein